MNKEIGGYIELDKYKGKMLYDNAVLLNCGRNALLYLIKTKGIRKLCVPKYMCNSNDNVLMQEGVDCVYYSIDNHFKPIINSRKSDEWLYLVNYYGQLSNEYIKTLGNNVIVDNAQAYFQPPIYGYDTIYSCRKFFGVPDGAILFTDGIMDDLPEDESYKRMNFLLGRYERSASEFFNEYTKNDEHFFDEPLKKMSKLTKNLLHAIDYDFVKDSRKRNFIHLHKFLGNINKLDLIIPEGAFMYPFYTDNGTMIRDLLKEKNIYIPILWPNVLKLGSLLEKDFAMNILPLPCDQRYNRQDMDIVINCILKHLNY